MTHNQLTAVQREDQIIRFHKEIENELREIKFVNGKIEALQGRIAGCEQTAVEKAWNMGRLLVDHKASMAHGQWLPWLDGVGISRQTARDYMALAKITSAGNLLPSIRKTIKALPDIMATNARQAAAGATVHHPDGSTSQTAADYLPPDPEQTKTKKQLIEHMDGTSRPHINALEDKVRKQDIAIEERDERIAIMESEISGKESNALAALIAERDALALSLAECQTKLAECRRVRHNLQRMLKRREAGDA